MAEEREEKQPPEPAPQEEETGEAAKEEAAAEKEAAEETAAEEEAAAEEVAKEAAEEEAAAEEAAGPAGITEEEMRRQLEEHFRRQSVSDLLVQFMVSLSNLAYVKMGITKDTAEIRDLEQARLAIDSFKGLLEAAEDRLEQQDKNALAGALASMQMTYAQVSTGSGE